VATKRQKVQVGVFLTAAGVLLGAVLFALAGYGRQNLVSYCIEFHENISGLTEGSKVTYQGVPVGKILQLNVTHDNRVIVVVGVDADKVILREGVRAKYSMETLFGPFVIDLFGGGDKDAPVLQAGATIEVQPSLMADIERKVPDTLSRLNVLIDHVSRLLSEVKPRDIPGLLQRIDGILASADTAVQDLNREARGVLAALQAAVVAAQTAIERVGEKAGSTLGEVAKATNEAARFFTTFEATVAENRQAIAAAIQRLDALLAAIEPQVAGLDLVATEKSLRETIEAIGRVANSLGETAATVGKAAESLATAAHSAAGAGTELRRSFTNIERSLERSLEELDRTLRAARRLLDLLERDPAALLRGKGDEPK
jgi:phospholipid/cholesterol/gamma-HCH transport system substrate-binding protein